MCDDDPCIAHNDIDNDGVAKVCGLSYIYIQISTCMALFYIIINESD